MAELTVTLLDTTVRLIGPASHLDAVAVLVPTSAGINAPSIDIEVTEADGLVDLLALLNRTALAQCRSYAVHAGAVARSGAVTAFPAVSGAGKTTLTAACLRSGFDYVSDEALVLATDGLYQEAAYTALSRSRLETRVYLVANDFDDDPSVDVSHANRVRDARTLDSDLTRSLYRSRRGQLALDR